MMPRGCMPDSCDTFVALPSVTGNKTVIFGKNSDRHRDEVQEVIYVPSAEHSAGSKLQCTYIVVEQVSHTHAVFLSKPAWMWGAEMGANEKGVAIGNEAVWTKEWNKAEDLKEKLLGMDMVRIGLERAGSAREALDVITSLVADPGQGGPTCEEPGHHDQCYHNSFIIADGIEAWVLETAGKHWAAEQVTDGVRNISNQLSIHSKIDRMSDGLKDYAKQKGYWDGANEFDFAAAFCMDSPYKVDGIESPANRFKCGKSLMEESAKNKTFDIQSMMNVLRDESSGICRVGRHGGESISTSSFISVLQAGSTPSSHWVTGTPNPSCSVFKPFLFCEHVRFGNRTLSPCIADDPAKVKPRFQKKVDRSHALYTAHSTIKPLPGDETDKNMRSILREMEKNCIVELNNYLDNHDASKPCELCELFKDAVDSEYKIYYHK